MRLPHSIPAYALALALLATALPAGSAGHPGASALIVSPAEGATVPARNATVVVQLSGFHGRDVQGYLMLDGAWAGTIPFTPVEPNEWVHAPLDARGFASGEHALTAHLFSSQDAPVTTPPVTILLDTPPVLSAEASYDLDARVLRVLATVQDESGSVRVELSAPPAKANASFVGTHEFVLPLPREPGSYAADLTARDELGQTGALRVAYDVADRPATIELVEASYLMADKLRVVVRASDADGVASVWAATSLGDSRPLVHDNATGTWGATLTVSARLGEHVLQVVSRDPHGGASVGNFTFTIAGVREVLFDRTVVTDAGLHADASLLRLPRVHDARIEICAKGDCGNTTWWLGAEVVATIREGGLLAAPRVCAYPSMLGSACAFNVRDPAGWNLDLAWKQAGQMEVTVRVTGVRI